jgi:FkbM family methyltransferase
MLISVSELSRDWGVSPNGVLHVGAHLGEEANEYENFGWLPAIWVEAQPKLVKNLSKKLLKPNHRIIEAAIWNENDVELMLNIASNSQSSSLLKFGSHSISYPDIEYVERIKVRTKRLDLVITPEEMPNFINLDIQGVELPAIQSLGLLIQKVDYIYVEVNRKEVYVGCTKVADLDKHLSDEGFERVTTRWYFMQGWGDALYVRRCIFQTKNLRCTMRSSFWQSLFYVKQIAVIFRTLILHPKSFIRVQS